MQEIKRIGVFTSGGDAPGMNAALRAVVRSACHREIKVSGIYRGYEGMIDGEINDLSPRDVGNIIHRGGTILKTARSARFMTVEGRKCAFDQLAKNRIDALVAIGGDGTFAGARLLYLEHGIPVVGLPGTIDNDLFGTDNSIGFDTAINTAIGAVDKIRDTADAHNRLFLIEVMGRHSGFIALYTAIASGASAMVIPEREVDLDWLISDLQGAINRKKLFGLVIVAEGNPLGSVEELARKLQERIHEYEVKVTVIGHIQRGGSPSAADRILASRLGHEAIEALRGGSRDCMVGLLNDTITLTPFDQAIGKRNLPDPELIELATILGL
ncbi:MAG: ATP-dependent 6-phosphofructokinase 1 [Saprospiraceae bacterium]|jgi:6-phosphofructokinase 1|nr:6-phosphofructokinase [Saprospiraceae bacterium]MBV6472089.1 ATP-dependent 6-phosphofructokinase 1 [Saprospiraceae bacterium]